VAETEGTSSGSGGCHRASWNIWVYNRAFAKWMGPIKLKRQLQRRPFAYRAVPGAGHIHKGAEQDAISVGSETLLKLRATSKSPRYPLIWSLYEGAVRISERYCARPRGKPEPIHYSYPWTPGGVRGACPSQTRRTALWMNSLS
jgi:hypothetical protein